MERGDYILASWGNYDRVQLKDDCKLHKLESNWPDRHINIKDQYTGLHSLRRAMGMKRALCKEGMDMMGTHHRGIDDARNLSMIFIKYFELWDYKDLK
ncbi:MAG: hypothetical protein KAI81_08365 [Candidatus Marinimicrobia bacterium]|nr:hypothetical protein [Candidatus Neomarinimicrobiota bacterium]